ncbi:MAG: glycine betaine/L-proline ABC transporter ATP-binding protein [Verrucomicrobiota bacterium JB022]|nr:glycine betaine/L-proline ABC transporter ATP-binding protein [Verrucomicrobiota bacterium JB022]
MSDTIIEVSHLYKIFGKKPKERALPLVEQGQGKAEVLKRTGCTVGINDASFSIKRREFFVIMGLSGSGKSTVIRCLNRLIEPTAGSIKIDGEEVTQLDAAKLREVRRKKLGMVFQRFGLLPHRTVIDNVAFGLEVQDVPKEQRYEKAMQAIRTVGLEGYEEKMTQELSGGMQQRVGLARALANDPEILLMDEAFSALDPLIRVQLQDELLELQARMHKTIVFITHDLDEALKLGSRIAIMKDGAVVQVGTPEEILTQPADDYVRAFVENVDRSKVLTASTIMKKTEVVYDTAGPHQAARKMRQLNLSTLIVVNRERQYLGYIKIDDVVELRKKVPEELDQESRYTVRPIIKKDLYTATPETAIADLVPYASTSALPIAVLDEGEKLAGIVTRPAILAGIAGD